MPKSRLRRSQDGGTSSKAAKPAKPPASGRWVAPTMVALLCIGLAWIVVWYVAGNELPLMSSLKEWNLVIGFGFIFAGLMVSTRWR